MADIKPKGDMPIGDMASRQTEQQQGSKRHIPDREELRKQAEKDKEIGTSMNKLPGGDSGKVGSDSEGRR